MDNFVKLCIYVYIVNNTFLNKIFAKIFSVSSFRFKEEVD